VPKFTVAERITIKSIVASLTIKRLPDAEIQDEILKQSGKTVSRTSLYRIRQSIKRQSFKWYKTMREGEYEYIHEFKERINEIMSLQKKHHEIIDSAAEPTTVKQTSLAELHRLNITLSNYFDVAPSIINDISLSITPQSKAATTNTEPEREFII
jgi:outer membrane protein assembly factor BamA